MMRRAPYGAQHRATFVLGPTIALCPGIQSRSIDFTSDPTGHSTDLRTEVLYPRDVASGALFTWRIVL